MVSVPRWADEHAARHHLRDHALAEPRAGDRHRAALLELARREARVRVRRVRPKHAAALFVVFCYTAVVLRLPRIEQSADVFGLAYFSNRSVAFPWLAFGAGSAAWGVIVAVGLVVAWLSFRVLRTREEQTGRPSYASRVALGVVVLAIAGGFLVTGMPAAWDVPQVSRFRYEGGLQLSPEFFGLLLALALFNAAFVAEIVRGAISSVPRGKREAAQALGLSSSQQLRLVVLPQAMRVMLPPLATQAQNLAKMASIAIEVAFPDLMNVGGTIINNSGEAIPVFILMTETYFMLNLVIALIFVGPQWRFTWSRGRRA